MKSILKKDRILVFVALLGLLASLAPLAARTKAEQSNRYYDYILDYSSLRYSPRSRRASGWTGSPPSASTRPRSRRRPRSVWTRAPASPSTP